MTATISPRACVDCPHVQRIHGPRPGLELTGPGCRADGCTCTGYVSGAEAARRAAHAELVAFITDLRASGLVIPCLTGSTERRVLWTTDNEPSQHRAALLCTGCRALPECLRYGRVYEPAGVWGGETPSERKRRR